MPGGFPIQGEEAMCVTWGFFTDPKEKKQKREEVTGSFGKGGISNKN